MERIIAAEGGRNKREFQTISELKHNGLNEERGKDEMIGKNEKNRSRTYYFCIWKVEKRQ